MTTQPAAGSGQALPARVVETLQDYVNALVDVTRGEAAPVVAKRSRIALLVAIADAIEAARQDVTRKALIQSERKFAQDYLDDMIRTVKP